MTKIKGYYLSIFVILAVITLSLAPMPDVPELGYVPLWDKWVHFIMYGGLCCVLWFDYFRNGHKLEEHSKWITYIVIFPILLGGLLELGQRYLTTYRSGDWIDFVANSIGVALAIPIGLLLIRRWFSN